MLPLRPAPQNSRQRPFVAPPFQGGTRATSTLESIQRIPPLPKLCDTAAMPSRLHRASRYGATKGSRELCAAVRRCTTARTRKTPAGSRRYELPNRNTVRLEFLVSARKQRNRPGSNRNSFRGLRTRFLELGSQSCGRRSSGPSGVCAVRPELGPGRSRRLSVGCAGALVSRLRSGVSRAACELNSNHVITNL